jgi:hypothetical protein
MSDYAIFFDYKNKTYRLPVNPEKIEVSTVQENEKYEILKLGQIVVPTHMGLTEYSFECELPNKPYHYVETPALFKNADYYLNLFHKWRTGLKPIRFIASNGIGDDINTLVLIEELTVIENAGEEGDKYINFKLIEYRDYGKNQDFIADITSFSVGKTAKRKNSVKEGRNPKSNGYHVVVSGDTLWSIAKKYYGDGAQYTKIYAANKDKVKNPALIQTGWKLVIPE